MNVNNLGPVRRGSVVHFNGPGATAERCQQLKDAIRRKCGHSDFIVVGTAYEDELNFLDEVKMRQYGWVRGDRTLNK